MTHGVKYGEHQGGSPETPSKENVLPKLSSASKFASVLESLCDQRHILLRMAHIQ